MIHSAVEGCLLQRAKGCLPAAPKGCFPAAPKGCFPCSAEGYCRGHSFLGGLDPLAGPDPEIASRMLVSAITFCIL